jgi:DNA helicase-4
MQRDNFNGMTILTVFVSCILLFTVFYAWKKWVRNKKSKQKLTALLSSIKTGISDYEQLTNYNNYFSNYQEQQFLQTNSSIFAAIPNYYQKVGLANDDSATIAKFLTIYKNTTKERAVYNERFVKTESEKYAYLFDTLESYPLSRDQVEAIIKDEDNNLVLAGAGTGKTTTISAKVAYLLTKGLAKPEDLLIISFTNNSVKEMYKRSIEFCRNIPGAENLQVRTFNSFGNLVSRCCSTRELLLAFDGKDEPAKVYLQQAFSDLFKNDPDFQKKATNFIAFFSRPERDEFEYETKNEYLKYEKSFENKTLDGKMVNSKEELQIGNFLCLFKIEYEYQKHFPLQPKDRNVNYAAYQPDFYFPEHEIWHEHYGIDRKGDVPKWFATKHPHKTARETYHAGILWKEEIHKKYGTKLIKTHSYENKENVLLSTLKKQLEDLGVEMKSRTSEELQELMQKSSYFQDFINLVYSFLNLLKSNGKRPHEINVSQIDKRLKVFMDVFTPLYNQYEQKLKNDSAIDFNDMVNHARTHIADGSYKNAYKYILVDEFQDMSLGRYQLLKSLRTHNPQAKLYAVGDDWQSIFRFSGSDISIITEFAEHFGFTSQSAILNTYRFNDEILKITSDFIQKNPSQLKKKLSAISTANYPSFVYHGLEMEGFMLEKRKATKLQCIRTIIEGIILTQPGATVFLICRYHARWADALLHLKYDFPSLKLSFFTAHSVKGLTADFSILLDLDSGVYGFPSEIADDPILNAVLHEGEKFDNAEERRLFYVATTRARHQNHLLYDQSNPSKFVEELITGNTAPSAITKERCPECNGIMVKRRGVFSEFYGCVNYPQCTGKLPLTAMA